MRLGYTILLNGKMHLQHGDFVKNMLNAFDLWVIVEGVAHPNGSTSWCKELPQGMVTPGGLSVDGTSEVIMDIWTENPNVEYITPPEGQNGWGCKDDMVNAACGILRRFCALHKQHTCFLWQVDVDEQWDEDDMAMAEADLLNSNGDCGLFQSNYFVGKNIVTRGTWGEGKNGNEYRRLWLWEGQKYQSHEPPVLDGGNGKEVVLPQRFNHYAYYFKEDVAFKEKYYGYANLSARWQKIQTATKFPIPITDLIDGGWGRTDTKIERLSPQCI